MILHIKRGSAIPYDEIQNKKEKEKEKDRRSVLTAEALEGTCVQYVEVFLCLIVPLEDDLKDLK